MLAGVLVGPGWGVKVYVWTVFVPDLRLLNGALAGQWGDGSGVGLTHSTLVLIPGPSESASENPRIVPQKEKASSRRA
jgi:hypothetical protein